MQLLVVLQTEVSCVLVSLCWNGAYGSSRVLGIGVLWFVGVPGLFLEARLHPALFCFSFSLEGVWPLNGVGSRRGK